MGPGDVGHLSSSHRTHVPCWEAWPLAGAVTWVPQGDVVIVLAVAPVPNNMGLLIAASGGKVAWTDAKWFEAA